MGPVTESLLRLQEIETQLWALRDTLAAKNRSVASQERKIQQLEQQTQLKREQLKHNKSDASSQELDIKAGEAEVGKLRNALNTAKTNKEYDAILTQINSDRAEIARQEEKELSVLATIDQVEGECEQAGQQIEQAKIKLENLRQAKERADADSKEKLGELEQAKSEIAESISPNILRIFERVGRNDNGRAMAAVVQNGARNPTYSCSGCYMSITIDTVDALMSKDEVRQCPNCQHLLYLSESEDK